MQDQEMPDEWKSRFIKWQSSGLSGRSWCRENQVSYGAFSYWRQKFTSQPDLIPELNTDSFLEITDSAHGISGLTLEYKGINIYLAKRFSEEALKRCLKLLKDL